jgi:hypothetical protein
VNVRLHALIGEVGVAREFEMGSAISGIAQDINIADILDPGGVRAGAVENGRAMMERILAYLLGDTMAGGSAHYGSPSATEVIGLDRAGGPAAHVDSVAGRNTGDLGGVRPGVRPRSAVGVAGRGAIDEPGRRLGRG